MLNYDISHNIFIEMLKYNGHSTGDRADCNGPSNGEQCDNDGRIIRNNTAIKHWESKQKFTF